MLGVLQSCFSAHLVVASCSPQGSGAWRGWGLWGAHEFGVRADQLVQGDLKGEKKGEMDFLFNCLAIARVLQLPSAVTLQGSKTRHAGGLPAHIPLSPSLMGVAL